MEPEKFDDLFFMSSCANIPGGIMGDFVNALVKHSIAATDAEGEITVPFMDLAEKAHIDSKFKLGLETVVGKFSGSDAEIYYNELRIIQYNDLTVITANDVNNAEKIVRELKDNPITSTIINLKTNKHFEVINQMKVSGFYIDDIEMKSMLDKVIVDHKEKTIKFFDLKCTWNVENFYREYYLRLRAYIQAYVYQTALHSIVKDTSSPFYGYKVLLPAFIVCDSINYLSPLIYQVTEKNLLEAYHGFEIRGYKYEGVHDIILNLKWAIENDKWNISFENFSNNGIANLK